VPGDRIVAVASSGVHSNGFSLVRRILETSETTAETRLGGDGAPVIASLLTPTRLYASLVQRLLAEGAPIRGMAHITGGGLPENLPRCLPPGVHARVNPGSWERPALFRWLQEQGEVPEPDLWNTFNLGVGFCLVVPPEALERVLASCQAQGHRAWELGQVEAGIAPAESADAAAAGCLAGLPF
jgi:phosphoribosylformylglycinamidine cyclo-ligase